jgi:hypothetical protein
VSSEEVFGSGACEYYKQHDGIACETNVRPKIIDLVKQLDTDDTLVVYVGRSRKVDGHNDSEYLCSLNTNLKPQNSYHFDKFYIDIKNIKSKLVVLFNNSLNKMSLSKLKNIHGIFAFGSYNNNVRNNVPIKIFLKHLATHSCDANMIDLYNETIADNSLNNDSYALICNCNLYYL